LDNANDRKQLHSSSLASVLTSVRWTDGSWANRSWLQFQSRGLADDGNNPNLHLELTRRCIRCESIPRVDRP